MKLTSQFAVDAGCWSLCPLRRATDGARGCGCVGRACAALQNALRAVPANQVAGKGNSHADGVIAHGSRVRLASSHSQRLFLLFFVCVCARVANHSPLSMVLKPSPLLERIEESVNGVARLVDLQAVTAALEPLLSGPGVLGVDSKGKGFDGLRSQVGFLFLCWCSLFVCFLIIFVFGHNTYASFLLKKNCLIFCNVPNRLIHFVRPIHCNKCCKRQ